MNRRNFHRHGAALLTASALDLAPSRVDCVPRSLWQSLEHQSAGRLGVAVLDTGSNTLGKRAANPS